MRRAGKNTTKGHEAGKFVQSGKKSCIFPLNMATRKTKLPELNPADLIGMSVREIDSLLSSIFDFTAMALGIRQHKADSENITTPPPSPPRLGGQTSPASAATPVRINQTRRAPNSLPEKPPRYLTMIKGSTIHTAYEIINRYPRGLDLPVFREEFDKLNTSGEGTSLHNKAVFKLRSTRHVVTYKKKLFTYDRLKQFLNDVEAGVVEDIPDEQPTLHGKWAVAVYEFIRSHNGGWVGYREIVDHIVQQPGFENAANVTSLVAVALKGLQYRHRSIEKQKRGNNSQYRTIAGEPEGDTPPETDLQPVGTTH